MGLGFSQLLGIQQIDDLLTTIGSAKRATVEILLSAKRHRHDVFDVATLRLMKRFHELMQDMDRRADVFTQLFGEHVDLSV